MTKPWLKNYPDNVNDDINLGQYGSLVDLLKTSSSTYGDKSAYIQPGSKDLSFAEVETLSQHFAAYLQNKLQVKKGDRIALMCPNLQSFTVAMWGILRAGAVQVNVNPLYTPRELEHQLNDAQVETIIIFGMSLQTLNQVVEQTSVKNIISVGMDELSAEVNEIDEHSNQLSFAQALAIGAKETLVEPELNAEDYAFLQYTGGTTGLSKGATLTHGSIIANILQYKEFAKANIEPGADTMITAIPMYHIFALAVNTLCYFSLGARNILIANPRDMASFVKVWQQNKITFFTGVNTLFNGLLHTPGFADADFSELKLVVGGGAAVQQAVADKWREVTGVPLHEGYGLSETSPIVSLNLTGNSVGIGFPLPMTDLSVRDDQGNPLPQGESGELCVKGPQVMAGYWNNAEATADSMSEDGYFKTGDVGYMDERGAFHIVDRKKDMILVSGFNVFPNEIEAEMAKMPGILESACVGVADDKTGEAVKLFAVKEQADVTEQDVIEFCRQRLTAYKVPKHVSFIDELPKSTVGKVLRRELR